MSENQENLKKDIKPVRPDASSSRLPRRTKGTVSLFSGVLTILNLVGLIVLFLWFFNTSGNQQQACLLYTSPSPRDVEEWRMPGWG